MKCEGARSAHNVSNVMNLIGDVHGKVAVLVDDMIDTAGTITNAAKALQENGAREVYACSTHAVFSPPAIERLSSGVFQEVPSPVLSWILIFAFSGHRDEHHSRSGRKSVPRADGPLRCQSTGGDHLAGPQRLIYHVLATVLAPMQSRIETLKDQQSAVGSIKTIISVCTSAVTAINCAWHYPITALIFAVFAGSTVSVMASSEEEKFRSLLSRVGLKVNRATISNTFRQDATVAQVLPWIVENVTDECVVDPQLQRDYKHFEGRLSLPLDQVTQPLSLSPQQVSPPQTDEHEERGDYFSYWNVEDALDLDQIEAELQAHFSKREQEMSMLGGLIENLVEQTETTDETYERLWE